MTGRELPALLLPRYSPAMSGRLWVLLAAGVSSLALGCGGKSATSERPGRDAGQAGSGAGPSDGGGGAAAGAGPVMACSTGEVRCHASGVRELCAGGGWTRTDFVCASNVAVDDDTGSYCITKTDGSYRCWGDEPAEALPAERYRQVQLARQGLIGLTEDGRLLARGTHLPPDFQPVESFSATNMWADYGVCALIPDGSFLIFLQNTYDGSTKMEKVEGPFASAACVFEGMAAGVLEDGSLWTLMPNGAPSGHDFEEVAFSFGIFCARRSGGAVACFAPPFSGSHSVTPACSDTGDCPIFPAGRYHSITATGAVACALDETGALICKRYDGGDMPVAPGPYTFAKGGRDILCAIRTDGSVACFRHGGGGFIPEVGAFAPVEPVNDSAW